jgi:hypothetical protein
MIPLPVGGVPQPPVRIAFAALLFAGSATLGGAAVGYVVGKMSLYVFVPLGIYRMLLAVMGAAVALTYVIAQSLDFPLSVPSSRWQVPRHWERLGHFGMTGGFGLVLGAGFLTVAPFIGYHLLLLWLFIAGDPVLGARAMGIFGMGRAVPILYAAGYVATRHADAPGTYRLIHSTLRRAHDALSPFRMMLLLMAPALIAVYLRVVVAVPR